MSFKQQWYLTKSGSQRFSRRATRITLDGDNNLRELGLTHFV